ncbi:hypothetical protein ACO2Q0_00405 [Phenylobacterium sp. VNQ135]|uniref:hypothetical protein n=1 Tax=Phenylobacterium sp. VNQ135 TaxID=3400922 RepID=UPI003BFEBF0A
MDMADDAADARLKALFALDAPRARDPAFQAEVMAAVMRREFRADLTVLAGGALVGGLALWAVWPVALPVIAELAHDLAPTAALLALAAAAVVVLGGRPQAALGLNHD